MARTYKSRLSWRIQVKRAKNDEAVHPYRKIGIPEPYEKLFYSLLHEIDENWPEDPYDELENARITHISVRENTMSIKIQIFKDL